MKLNTSDDSLERVRTPRQIRLLTREKIIL